jgi:nucleoside-diphosphate-sugar epimerase
VSETELNVFIAGATGYIGSAAAAAVASAGHTVTGLAHSDESAETLEARGYDVHRGDIRDPDSLVSEAAATDGVIYAATFPGEDYPDVERTVLEALLDALEGSNKPLIQTTGSLVYGDTGSDTVTEDVPLDPPPFASWRVENEALVLDAADRGIRTVSLRLPLVYGRSGGDVLPPLVKASRQAGVGLHIDNGEQRWSPVHVDDVGNLYRVVIENSDVAGGTAVNGAASSPVSMQEVAAAISRGIGADGEVQAWPVEEAADRIGPLANGLVINQRLSGERARNAGWSPSGPSIIEELESGSYQRDSVV